MVSMAYALQQSSRWRLDMGVPVDAASANTTTIKG